ANETKSYGVAWGDYDNDGDLDLYVANALNQENLLYQNEGDGTFTEVGAITGVNDRPWGYGISWGDYDNDGDLDLYLANDGRANRLYQNNGNANRWLVVKLVSDRKREFVIQGTHPTHLCPV
ncbi:MAG: VCBS repeat-containing protein, partial [Candidatus Binatia bacterium]|nr:VCBS repeat-containing protein [Candidatus Binatia bacterium]